MKLIATLLVILIFGANAQAQILLDTVVLQEITIIERSQVGIPGIKTVKIDSINLTNKSNSTLSELLKAKSSLQIRSQGPGALSTSSYRGAGSSHTSVMWNGLDINSPTLGQSDLSPIPVSFIDEIEISQLSSENKSISSSNIGFLQLKTNPEWNNKYHVELMQNYGSFRTSQTSIKTLSTYSKVQIISRFYRNNSKNNFPYKYNNENAINYRKNAGYKTTGLLEEIYFKATEKSQFSLKTWGQESKNQIPSQIQKDKQNQQFIRNQLSYEYSGQKIWISSQFGLIFDHMKYHSSSSDINYSTKFQTIQNLGNLKWNWKSNIIFESGYCLNQAKIMTDNYIDNKYDTRANTFESLHYNWKKISGFVQINQHFSKTENRFYIPTIGLEYRFLTKPILVLKSAYSKNFKSPGMNDLYWNADTYAEGNPDLKNESGFNTEAGFELGNVNQKIKWKIESTLFYSKIDDWIIWMQGIENNPKWKPYNLKIIERKGIEFLGSFKFNFSKYELNINASFDITSSKNLHPIRSGDDSGGKQLMYVPKNQSQVFASVKYLQNEFEIQYQGNGISYSSTDNYSYLKPWKIVSGSFRHEFKIQSATINLGISCNNITNTNYSILQGFPMPGRWFETSLRVKFLVKNKIQIP